MAGPGPGRMGPRGFLTADKILVVKDGVIAEQGTHEELLALEGTYKELYETQFRRAIESEAERVRTDINILSTQYSVRKISEADISQVYRLAKSNSKYYEYMQTVPTKESLTEVISEMPEGTLPEQKHFVGFYERDNTLVAVLDLITGYPERDDAFIGWLMVDGEMHGRGVGSGIFADVRAAMRAAGYDYLSLACLPENEEALKFWKAQGFSEIKESENQEGHKVIVMGRGI